MMQWMMELRGDALTILFKGFTSLGGDIYAARMGLLKA